MRITEAELQKLLGKRATVAPARAVRVAKDPVCYRCKRSDGELTKTGGDNRLYAHPQCELLGIQPPTKSARRVLYRGDAS